jgi:hypothetical protein
MCCQDLPGEKIHSPDLVVTGQGSRQLQHVLDLAAGIGVATQLRIFSAYQTVDTDENEV